MKKLSIFLLIMVVCSCGNNDNTNNKSTVKEVGVEEIKQTSEINFEDIFGVWEGRQDSYYLINKYGDYVFINGKQIVIPEVQYNFLFEPENTLSIQQKADNEVFNYTGTYNLVDSDNDILNFSLFARYSQTGSLDLNIAYDKANDLLSVSTKDKSPNFILTRKGKSKKEKLLFKGSGIEAGAIFIDFVNLKGRELQFVFYDGIEDDIININNYSINKTVKTKFCCDFLEDNAEYLKLINKAIFEVEYFVDKGKNDNTDFNYNIIVDYVEDNTLDASDFNIDFYGIFIGATKNEIDAKKRVKDILSMNYPANYLWIPDYKSLSGAEMYGIYIGPYYNLDEFSRQVENYRKSNPSAYGLLVSNSNERVEIRGPGKIKKTKNLD